MPERTKATKRRSGRWCGGQGRELTVQLRWKDEKGVKEGYDVDANNHGYADAEL